MWISRDKDGELNLFIEKPLRMKECWSGVISGTLSFNYVSEGVLFFDRLNGFENLTWEDEPVEVSLTNINIRETSNIEGHMWVSRDKDGELNLFIGGKPRRWDANWDGQIIGTLSYPAYWAEEVRFDKIKGFENLTWEDDPVEVSLTTIK